jgi:hypothetical protein
MTRLPQLEQELAAAALRIHRPAWVWRRAAPVAAAAAAAAAVAAVALLPGGGESEPTRPADAPEVSKPLPPRLQPIDGTRSARQTFEVGGTRYSAVGFRSRGPMICASLREPALKLRLGTGCLSTRLLPKALERTPAHVFAGGGLRDGGSERTGFARADVVGLRSRGATVFLSEPWRPWERGPIRFFMIFTPDVEPKPGLRLVHPLHVQLADGSTVVIRR